MLYNNTKNCSFLH